MDFTLYEHKKQKDKKTVVKGENKYMEYRAKSTAPENLSKNQMSDYIVGIWDKEHHKIRLIDVDHFYTLTQHSKHAQVYRPVKDNLFEDVEYYEQKNELVNVFGTKKAKQKMQQMKSNIVEESSINTAKQMNKILKHDVQKLINEDERKAEEGETEGYAKDVLPDHDVNETKPENVYRKESILPKELHEFINFKELHRAVKGEKELTDEMYNLYERTSVFCMKYIVEEEKKQDKLPHHKFRVRASIYMTYLIRFYRCKNVITMDAKEMEEHLGIPKDISEHLLNTYAELTLAKGESNKKFHYVRNKKMQDKLLCHIIVLMLIIRDYKIDVKWIISALKIDFTKLVTYLRMVSCFPKKVRKAETEGEGDAEKEPKEKQRKNEWALDDKGSLMVYLKAPMRLQNKDRKDRGKPKDK